MFKLSLSEIEKNFDQSVKNIQIKFRENIKGFSFRSCIISFNGSGEVNSTP